MIISRDKSLLFPYFSRQLYIFEHELDLSNLPFKLFMGLRDFETQDELYAQGRTMPGKIVTNAKGGDSWHNYGLAADYVLDLNGDKPGLMWSWDLKADTNSNAINDWKEMAEIAIDCGLESGYFWRKFPDVCHLQNRYDLSLADAKELYRLGGIQRVWEECYK